MNKRIGLKRDTLDKFYTKPETVRRCMDLFQTLISVGDEDTFIEPSAGSGSFLDAMKQAFPCNPVVGLDIQPEAKDILQGDFLTYSWDHIKTPIHIIGNPPFGRQSSLAIRFLKKSCLLGKSISFILPKSFKKDSMRKHISPMFHLVAEIDLDPFSFLVQGKEHDVQCVFQVWEKRCKPRERPGVHVPLGFSFVKKQDQPHIAFRRVGVNAGCIFTENITDKNSQSHYFIKLDSPGYLEKLLVAVANITYPSADNTVGPKSISKQEIIRLWNPYFQSF